MNKRLKNLFTRTVASEEAEPLGEDMVPSPVALAERSALSTAPETPPEIEKPSPFSSVAPAPMRDFTG